MNNLNNIPGEIIKTSALPENVPTHLVGVIMGTSPQTVKYSTQSLALSVSNLITNVVKTDQFYSNPSWITSIDWSKLTNVPSFSTSLASLSDVQLGILNVGEALVYNGTKWVNQSIGELDTLNSVTTRGNTTLNSITTGGLFSPYLRLDTTATTTLLPGMFAWNDIDGTADLRLKGNNVTLQLGQETLARVVNKTGADLLESEYKVVRVRIASEGGAQGQRLAVVLAQGNNDPDSVTTLGIVTENISNNQEGFITVFGNVSEINTTGSLQGETWVDGDVLFLSPTTPGSLTKVKPIAPNHTVVMGYVVYAHANHGKIFVKVDNGYELEELHDVLPTPYVNNGVLYRDTATNLWKSATIATLLGGTPLLTVPTLAQVTTAGNSTTNAITVGGLVVDTDTLVVDSVNNRVGIGTTSPNVRLEVSGDVRFVGSSTSGATMALAIYNSTVTELLRLRNDGLLIINNSSNVLIGTSTNAGYKLDVNGTVRLVNNSTIITNSAGTRTAIFSGGNLDLSLNYGSIYLTGSTAYGFLQVGQTKISTTEISGFNNFFLSTAGDNVYMQSRPNTVSNIRFFTGSNGAATTNKGTLLIADYGNLSLTPEISAQLQVESTVKGFLPPRMTTTQKNAISTPAAGLIVFDTTLAKHAAYSGSAWETFGTTFIRRSDFVIDTDYMGVAVSGSSESANVWKIYKIVVSSSGTTTKTSATNVAWTERYTVTYS